LKKILFYFLFLNQIFSLDVPKFEEVKNNFKSSEVKILDRNGLLLNESRVNKFFRSTEWSDLQNISESLKKALLIAEDKKFYEHEGVDWKALSDGMFRYLTFQKKRGGSTVSMQLSTFLNSELKGNSKGRNFSQKWDQIQYALALEKNWTKEQILEAYFNLAPFKGELIGIDSASRALFKKEPHGINSIEASILVSFFKSPSGSEERIFKRACYIFLQIEEKSDCEEIKNIVSNTFKESLAIKPKNSYAFHITQYTKKNLSKKIITTLDRDFQIFAEMEIAKQLLHLKSKNVHDASLVLLDNKTGDILAYVGSSEKTSKSKEIDGVNSLRQAGSTLKPFIYAWAIQKNYISEDSILNDNPIDIQVGNGIYSPSNYQDKFHGDVSVRTALASSLNVPAVKIFTMLDSDEFIQLLNRLGFANLRESEFYGPSIALGSVDITLKELTNAYRTLANEGLYSEIQMIKKEKIDSSKIFEKETVKIISDILSDKEARSITFGLENPLVTKFPSSVKTGTSKDMRDNWCVGYNENYTLGVWVGNFSGEPMWNVSGVTGAAPIWNKVLNQVSTGKFYQIKTAQKKSNKIEILQPKNTIRILSPVKNSIYAVDPEMPEEVNSISFETNLKDKNYSFRLKKQTLSNTDSIYFWKPKKGRFHLELVDKKNTIVDSVDFEVR
jgi:penicillin-binding protein 1C